MKFNESYNRESFEIFLQTKLFGDNFKRNLESLNIDRKTHFFDNENCFKLGKVTLDEDISVFEIKQRSKQDPRITLTKDAFKIMQDTGTNYALVIFYSDDSSSYRLSLLTTKRIWGEKEESSPKRYSFLLGKGEKTKTPEKYLNRENKEKVRSFQELLSCFDVEVVRKEFFNHYLDLYIRLHRAVKKDVELSKLLQSQKIDLVSFTKNLLGKIVFLYFIQKKGWLGVPKNGEYGKDGDRDFMRSFWNDFKSNNKTVWEKTGYFYNDYLEHLFYEGLNKDSRDNNDLNDYFNFKVPYLNGGLFKKDYENWNINKSKISNDIFSNKKDEKDEGTGILDIFDTYNFTIDEDDLYDKEVAVDPEMLGKIFEKMISISSDNIDDILKAYEENEISGKKKKIEIDNLLNKKLGAFYTPREIVHYMTKESLIAYLINNLKGKKEDNERQVRSLFEIKEQFLINKDDLKYSNISDTIFEELVGIVEETDSLLQKVKILDPAIGSGAFPMGILHEMSSIRYYIYGVFYKTFGINTNEFKNEQGKISMYKIKRDIIQNNIYGVDISPGAIDIAKLRFWLSLVVDEETPEPLPNFEFKFVCANTLIPLEEELEQTQLGLSGEKEINVETLRKYMISYYNSQSNKDKEEWKTRIEKFLGIWKDNTGFGKNIKMDLYSTKSPRTKQLETYEPFNTNHSAEFFDPSLMMGNSKFDIVIGNPPYIKEYDNRNAFDGLRNKAYYIGKMDLWYYFACYGLDLLKDGGIESFIAQNNWITSFGAKIMRDKILEDSRIKEFIDFGDFKVFETAGIQTMIYILEKTKSNTKYEVKYSKLENKDFDRRNLDTFLFDTVNTLDYQKHCSKIEKSKYLGKTLDFVNDTKDKILEKISNEGNFKLTEKEVANGIHHHHDYINKDRLQILGNNHKIGDGIFVLSEVEKENLKLDSFEKNIIKPTHTTQQIGRYFADPKNIEFVIYTDSSFKDISKIENYPNIKKHLDKYKEVITSDNKPYGLHRSREEKFFIGEKIVATRKCLKPSFSYVSFDSYVSATFYVIKTEKLNLKYLTGLLNSKLVEFWLKNKGKMQGNNFQLDKEPILNIPIKKISQEEQKPFIEIVDKILDITKKSFYDPKNPPKEQLDLEKEINDMTYKLYGLSGDEIRVIEESLK